MRNTDVYGLIIITLIMGGMFTFLGLIIKSQNAGDMLNGFDAKKYDKDKVSRIVGGDMLYTGLLIILIGVGGGFFSSKFYNYLTIAQVVIFVLGIIKSIYDMDKKCRIKK
ncbi:DUF3784 domain-containing protein [Clostridium sp. CM028]|uniref:DUF3784 domain-containing protein n=1 Tax=Clostridium sp. CM028 TaxID=2851575 RepID=UPI001C6E3FF8|nr:DUF3784 domain-containing protein [Clostridium sp. CM028]MBW9148101.1 DUF3784 domain-containing protein [Clostridium sp. CM028]WLC62220.1 DUF3784 domain-containing protein [Clostridium sp. CM028]